MGVGVKEIPLEKLVERPTNFFRALTADEITELSESIKSMGILHPLLVRPLSDGRYEVVSGHQRKKAAERAGLKTVPCVVKEMDDDEAELAMIDANLETRQLSTMEMARAIRRKKEILGIKQGKRANLDLTSDTVSEVAKQFGITERHLRRLDKLNDLIPEFQEMVDEGKLTIRGAEKLAGLPQEMQRAIFDVFGEEVTSLSKDEIAWLKKENERGFMVLEVLQEKLKETEERLAEFRKLYESKENLEKEIKELQKKKRELEYDIMDRENALSEMEKRAVRKGTVILELLNQACRPIQAVRPELEVLFGECGTLDEGISVYILRWAEVLRDTARFLEESVKQLSSQKISAFRTAKNL